ncbi:MAG: methyltransferase domain-containing protein [Clostridia bacterium]|nr:methyltransferase domain-containing protein [Clostridia bacterium]
MFWTDWRELEKHNDWGVRDKDDATAALWNGGAEQWERRSAQELDFARRQVEALDRITKETTVLDVCCGTGPLTLPLLKKAKHVTAFDFNENMLDFVRKKAAEAGAENLDFLQGNFNTIEPGRDFAPAEIAVTRHSPAQGNILKFSRFATKYCYSLCLCEAPKNALPLPGRNGGRWLRSSDESRNTTPRPDGRKYGLNIHFNLLYEAGANPEIRYVTEDRLLTAPTCEELAQNLFPVGSSPALLEYVKQNAKASPEGLAITRRQTMAVMGWDPNEIQWDFLEKLGVDW